MSKRISLIVLTVLAFALLWSGAQRAVSQDDARKQSLVINYPNPSIVVSNAGSTPVRYGGIIYVSVFQAGGDASKKPVATAELTPSQRDIVMLPLGEYEVHFGMRTGSTVKTFILRNIILRPERASQVTVEMNADAKTTIIGGDMTAQEMADAIRQLQKGR